MEFQALIWVNVYGMSADLNRIEMGCHIGNHKINYLMFADDLCCFAPSIHGFRKLVRICEKYALGHVINFNPDKTVGMCFPSPLLKLNIQSTVSIRESNRLKYRSGSGSRNLIFNGSVSVQVQDFSKIWVQVWFGFSGTKV